MFLHIHNRRIHYELENFSPEQEIAASPTHTIVLIHGLGQNLRCWDFIVPYLSNYRIIRYDLAGHGESDEPDKEHFQLLTFTNELHALLRHLGVKQATLYGFELGACIALNYASQFADEIESVISVAHPVYYPDSIRMKKYEKHLKTLQSKGIEDYINHYLPSITLHSDAQTLRESYAKVSMNTYQSIMQLLKSADLVTDFKLNSCPVMQMAGDQDELYPPQLMFQAIQYFPATILVQVPNAKSLVHIDNPEYTAKRVDSFINQYKTHLSDPLVQEASLYYRSLKMKDPKSTNRDKKQHLRIHVLQRFEVSIDGKTLAGNWKSRKAQELLLYLIIHKNVQRDKLYDLFWPHLNLENAQNMLRVSINHLKKLVDKPFGTKFIQSKRDRIELTGTCSCDLLDLLDDINHFHACRNDSEKEGVARRICLEVSPRLLEGYYSDWIISLRDEIFYTAAPIIRWVANWYESQNRLMDSIYYYKLLLNLLPEELEVIKKIAQLYDRLHLKGIAGEWQDKYLHAVAADD